MKHGAQKTSSLDHPEEVETCNVGFPTFRTTELCSILEEGGRFFKKRPRWVQQQSVFFRIVTFFRIGKKVSKSDRGTTSVTSMQCMQCGYFTAEGGIFSILIAYF